jgi:hypothetical protein
MKLTLLKSTTKKYMCNVLNLRSLLFFSGIVCFTINNAIGQVSTTYTCSQTSLASYVPLTAGKTALISGAWTDTSAPASINIGSGGTGFSGTAFDFKFDTNSIPSNLIYVSPNGYVTFGASPGADATSSGVNANNIGNFRQPLASALGGSSGAIAVFGARLRAASAVSGNISYEVTGTAPNRILKVEWLNFHKYNVATNVWETSGITWSMQLWLYETTNVIENRYSTQTDNFNAQAYGQIGLRGYSSALATMTYINALSYTGSAWPTSPSTMAAAVNNTDFVRVRNSVSPTVYVTAGSNRLFQWTPVVVGCAAPPSVTVSNILINTANATFTSSSGTNFQYVVSTSNTAPSGAGTACTSPLSISGLSGSTQYYLWVRTDCGAGGFSTWTSSGAFTTLCTAKPDPIVTPYVQNFNSVSSGVPACTAIQSIAGSAWTVNPVPPADTYSSGYTSNYLLYSQTAATANSWFFTEGINMTAGKTYRLSYLYGGTVGYTNKMDIKYGLAPNATSMTNPLDTDSLIKGPGNSNIILFTPSASTVYYFGFKVFSASFQGFVFLEDVKIDPSNCDTPTGLTASNINSTTADISWTQPASNPGYVYYVTPANPSANAGSFTVGSLYQILTLGTTDYTLIGASSNAIGVRFTATGVGSGTGTAAAIPTNLTVPTGTVANGVPGTTLTGLATATTYYVWVRSSCGSGDFSPWSPSYITFTTPLATSYCVPSATTGTSYISNFKTTGGYSNINNFTSYALPSGYADYSSQIVSQAAGATINFTSITTSAIGFAIWVDWNNDGVFNNTDYPAGERMYKSSTSSWVTSPSGSFVIPGAQGTNTYRMRVMIDWYAYTPNPCLLAGSTRRGEIEDYSVKVITPPPALTLSASSSSQCVNVASPSITLTSAIGNYNTYTWSPSTGVSGNATSGWVFTNSATTVYTLNAIQTVSPFGTNSTTFTYNAANVPSSITITPSPAASCQGGTPVLLTASGGTVANSVALSENFETGATTWTTTNTSTPTVTVNSVLVNDPAPEWTIRTNGYNRPPQFTSNDSSSFMLSDSDAQGSGTSTVVTLSSPVFSLANYSSATLNFYHYYRSWTPSTANVNISTNGGSTWTTLQSYTTVTQGSATSFAAVSIDLSAYLGQTNLKIQFSYSAGWGYYWAIDNVLVNGTKLPQFVWTPITGLYSDSAGLVPYVSNAVSSTVYAFPTATTTYTATTSSATNCSNSNTVVVTYYPQAVAGVASSDQSNCDPAAFTAITLAGPTVGSVVRWEYADDLAFTTNVTPIVNTTSTLPTSQFGAFTGARYFRAVVANGTCANVYSNVITISTAGTTWNGGWTNGTPDITKSVAFASNYTITSNMSACSVQVAAGVSVTVNPGITLTVQNGVTLSSPALATALVFENDSSLLQVNNTVNVGSIVYKRNSTSSFKFDYTYWSSPVASQTLIGLSPGTSVSAFFDYNPSISNWQQSNSALPMSLGKGYLIRVPNTFPVSPSLPQIFTANFVGVPNNGDIPLTIVHNPANELNLIGNPYPSALSAFNLVTDPGFDVNDSLLGGTVYFWTHNTNLNLTTGQYTAGDYAVWNVLGGTGTAGNGGFGSGNVSTPTGNIASGQGFFINTITSGTAYFRNSMRTGGATNSNFYRTSTYSNVNTSTDDTDPTASIEKHRIWLDISNTNNAYKQLLVGYIEGGTDGLDRLYDGKMVDNGNQVALYTMVDQEKLTIQGRGLTFTPNDTFPLGFKSTVASNYSINLYDFDGLFTSQNIYLEDKLLNVIHDLKDSPYTFATTIGTFEGRFVLRFTNQALGVPVFSENTVVVYKNEGDLYVDSGTMQMNAVAIYDIMGRLITAQNDINAPQTKFTSLPSTNQVLLVQITSETGVKVTKKVVY